MMIELHALQTFAPSNLNRDDTGNPKDALFGGVRRARVSSQSGKRAIRVSEIFQRATVVPNGTRTKGIIKPIVSQLVANGVNETDATSYVTKIIEGTYAKLDKKSAEKTSVILFVSDSEITMIVSEILDALNRGVAPEADTITKKLVKEFENRTSAPDIALFGRMLAEKPALNIDAACQMAHALSTHEVNTAEFDYFTAVDDLQANDVSGADMLGLVAFNSATYYRCARIDWEQLVKNLRGDTDLARQTVAAFMYGFALVVPSGMKNSFINQHTPDFLLAVVRPDNNGQSLANAFEKPVRVARGGGFSEPSIQALAAYWERTEGIYRLEEPVVSVVNPHQHTLESKELAGATKPNLQEWVSTIASVLE